MGVAKQQQLERRAKAKPVVKQTTERRSARRALRGDQTPLKWRDVTPAVIMSVLQAVTSVGGGITFTQSRDGGALV